MVGYKDPMNTVVGAPRRFAASKPPTSSSVVDRQTSLAPLGDLGALAAKKRV
jgi:hypothetical protein